MSTRMTFVEMIVGNTEEAQVAAVPADDVIGIVTVIQRGVAATVLESEIGTDIAKGMVTMAEVRSAIEIMEAVEISIIEIEIGIEIGIVKEIAIGNEIEEAHQAITGKETDIGGETVVAKITIIIEKLVDQNIIMTIPKNAPNVGIMTTSEIGRERMPEKRRAWLTV